MKSFPGKATTPWLWCHSPVIPALKGGCERMARDHNGLSSDTLSQKTTKINCKLNDFNCMALERQSFGHSEKKYHVCKKLGRSKK